MQVGYARVSTRDQNPDMQLSALKAAGCEWIFVETASGAKRDRPELKAALDHLRHGDTLVIWKVDRLARSLSQLVHTFEDLRERGIGLKILSGGFDTATPAGRAMFQMAGVFAEFERELNRERTLEGLVEAAQQGRKGGRRKSLTGEAMAIAHRLLQDEDIPVRAIAEQLGVSRMTFYRYFPAARTRALAARKA